MPSRKKDSEKSSTAAGHDTAAGSGNGTAAGSGNNNEQRELHMRVYTNWVNDKLKNSDHHVGYLPKDLQDGLILIKLLEILSGKKVPGK